MVTSKNTEKIVNFTVFESLRALDQYFRFGAVGVYISDTYSLGQQNYEYSSRELPPAIVQTAA